MEQFRESVGKVLKDVGSCERGLSSAEAARRLEKYGRNVLDEGKKKSKLKLFFSQFKDLMTLILVAAAVLSGVLAYLTHDTAELVDTGILLAVILLNAFVGFLQEYRADAALAQLKKLSVAEAKAVRDGKVTKLNAEELTIGDVIEVEEGDRIPADCRILQSEEFRCDESALTGESRPVKKYDCIVDKGGISERRNTAFLSTYCVKGSARCVVVGTGMHTEVGRIASLLHENKPAPSPLDCTLTRLGKIITATVLAVSAVLFAGGLLAGRLSFLENVMAAVALAVAAIPEGMGAVVTVILALGVQRMAKEKAVMRRLSAVEALGGCSVICTDKTGTLTKNRMTVEEVAADFGEREGTRGAAYLELLRCIRACHTVKGSAGSYLGDPTEIALLEYADACKYEFAPTHVGGTPFTSERKMMSVLASFEGGTRLYVKGGADVLLKKCERILTEKGELPLSPALRREILRRADGFSARAMRVLGFAYGEKEEKELVFCGLAAMLDPPKEGVKEAVAACRRAGVRTVIITGDGAETAFAIASSLGIASRREEVVTGDELDTMSTEELAKRVQGYAVFARVSPKHKSEIVQALQACGETVAMTGDGVNDAPALRAADVGVAMGSGTDVTKNAADVVISDDNFATIVRAIEEGRNVFLNVKRTVSFFLATNLAEVLSVLAVSLLLWQFDFLTSTQLLFVNLVTDSLPVLALGVEKTEGAMLRPPVSNGEIFSRSSLLRVAFFGVVQAALVVGLFAAACSLWGNGTASTMAFVSLSLLELLHGFNVKCEDTVPRFFSNKTLVGTVLLGVALSVLLVLTPLRTLFGLTKLTLFQWGAVFATSLLILPIGSLWRAVTERGFKRHGRRIPLPESTK